MSRKSADMKGGREGGGTYLAHHPIVTYGGDVAVVELGEPAEVGEPPPHPVVCGAWRKREGGREGRIGER